MCVCARVLLPRSTVLVMHSKCWLLTAIHSVWLVKGRRTV